MDTRKNTFKLAAWVYAGGTLLHTLDHFRRLHREGKLDTAELDTTPAPLVRADEA